MNSTELEKITLKFVNQILKPGFLYKHQGRTKRIQLYRRLDECLITSDWFDPEYSLLKEAPFMIAKHVCVECDIKSLGDPNNPKSVDPSIQMFEKMVTVYTKVLFKAEFMGWISFAEFYFKPESQELRCWELPNDKITPEFYMQLRNDICSVTENDIL